MARHVYCYCHSAESDLSFNTVSGAFQTTTFLQYREDIPQIAVVVSANAITGNWTTVSILSVIFGTTAVVFGIVKRGLERLGMRHTQYSRSGSEVMPAGGVARPPMKRNQSAAAIVDGIATVMN